MLNKGTASLEVSRSHEQRLEPRVREFRKFGTASLRGITVFRILYEGFITILVLNPISTGIFFDAYVPGGVL